MTAAGCALLSLTFLLHFSSTALIATQSSLQIAGGRDTKRKSSLNGSPTSSSSWSPLVDDGTSWLEDQIGKKSAKNLDFLATKEQQQHLLGRRFAGGELDGSLKIWGNLEELALAFCQ